jgi:hypothetical protein
MGFSMAVETLNLLAGHRKEAASPTTSSDWRNHAPCLAIT